MKTNLCLTKLFEVHITLGFQSEVSAFIYFIESALQKHRRKNVPALPISLCFEIPLLYQHTWSGDSFILADVQKNRVGGRLIMFSSNEQIELLLNSTTWFCDGTFKTRPLLFEQVYIIQCLVGDQGILYRLFFLWIKSDLSFSV